MSKLTLKFEQSTNQVVGEARKVVGFVKAKAFIDIIDNLDLKANPRDAKIGDITNAIEESITNNSELFPFKTKGVLIGASEYIERDRNRYEIFFKDLKKEGILDGGHNTLAICTYILRQAFDLANKPFPVKRGMVWSEFADLWIANYDLLLKYKQYLVDNQVDNPENLEFFVPVELILPRDSQDADCVKKFNDDLFEICAARNNNVQLDEATKANAQGYYDVLINLMNAHNKKLSDDIVWKTNSLSGTGNIKVNDIIALAWIPLNMVESLKGKDGKPAVSPIKVYSGKASALDAYTKMMKERSFENAAHERDINDKEIKSALELAVQMPELYDYIYAKMPSAYNEAGGRFLGISSVASLNKAAKSGQKTKKYTPFLKNEVEIAVPEGFIAPLVYGLQALMERANEGGQYVIRWKDHLDPMAFLEGHLTQIVSNYMSIMKSVNYDPQKIGKNMISYQNAYTSYQMILNGMSGLNF